MFWFLQKVTFPWRWHEKLHLTAKCSKIAEMLQCSIERTHVVFPIFFSLTFPPKTGLKITFNDTFICQSLHHLLTPNASSFFVKSSAVFIRENFLRFAGLQFEVGDDCIRFHLRSVTTVKGVYYDSLSSAPITTEVIGVIWSSWNTWENF